MYIFHFFFFSLGSKFGSQHTSYQYFYWFIWHYKKYIFQCLFYSQCNFFFPNTLFEGDIIIISNSICFHYFIYLEVDLKQSQDAYDLVNRI